jgi:predicted RNA polymerase sigma factor
VSATDLHRTIEAVWRIESARVIAGLTRLTRDVGLAEDLVRGSPPRRLEQWPQSGVPENPAAWLTATAKRSAIDDTSAHCSTTVRIGISATDGQAVNPGHGFPA